MLSPLTFLLSLLISFSATNSENIVINGLSSNVQITNFQAMQEKGFLGDAWPYIQMIDASTKIPNGIAAGSLYDLGNFDECYNIQTEKVTGKYCTGFLYVPSDLISVNNQTVQKKSISLHPTSPQAFGMAIAFNFAVCVPSSMSAEDINKFTITSIYENYCYSKDTEPELSTGAIITICILATVLGIAIIQTIYDVFLHYKQQKPMHELMIAFSFFSNGKKLIAASTNPDQLLCLNGIKALSMMWVVTGHLFSNIMTGPMFNTFDSFKWMNDAGNMYIMGGAVSVDTFFLVGGLVTVYTFLKATDKGVKFNIILYYIHRILRLTPALGVAILIHRNLLPYIEKAPLWATMYSSLTYPCVDNWWKSLFYIGNYFLDNTGICVPQAWYLFVDMQLFIFSPIILIPLMKWRKYTVYALYGLTLAGCVIPFGIAYGKELGTMMNDPKYMSAYYVQTYARFAPYVIGMLLGYYIYENKKSKEKIYIPKLLVCAAWIMSLTVLVACVYTGHKLFVGPTVPVLDNSFYLALDKPAWSAAVGAIIFLCVSGYGGPVDAFLSMHIFQFITKLSYSIYLVHYAVITIRYTLLKTPIVFSPLNLFHLFWGDFMFSLIISVGFCLLFESPIIILEKYMFKR